MGSGRSSEYRAARAKRSVLGRVGRRRVVLTGGCFQNARLTEQTVDQLCAAGFAPYFHHRVPPNDGGLAVGQVVFAAQPLVEEKP